MGCSLVRVMNDLPLGKPTTYPGAYDPGVLVPIDRAAGRDAAGITEPLPFSGEDVWHGYELSWLTPRGMPRVAGLRLAMAAESPRMVESKSMKLYLNGFAQTAFADAAAVAATLERDLADASGAPVDLALVALSELLEGQGALPGDSLDHQDVTVEHYRRDPDLLALAADGSVVEETLHTDLFRSLCPVTGQPDWASVMVRYRGPAIDRAALLRYLISYRQHEGFHETTIEQIFVDLKARCACERLMVAGFFLRRGGLDINPVRSDGPWPWPRTRTPRQ